MGAAYADPSMWPHVAALRFSRLNVSPSSDWVGGLWSRSLAVPCNWLPRMTEKEVRAALSVQFLGGLWSSVRLAGRVE